jgi:hypothetical protein
MKDFTLKAYASYLAALKKTGYSFYRFDEFIPQQHALSAFILLRHDVDRKPLHSLAMARLESEMSVKATYYFRMRPSIFVDSIVTKIAALGHEIGYHYECLSDSNGDFSLAQAEFNQNLEIIRKVAPVKTISMHGSPLKPYDNRDMWRSTEQREHLMSLGLLGEIYLEIDYSDIAYVNDTGRNWNSGKSNRRDQVISNISADFDSKEKLIEFFQNPHPKIVFQVHPERWSDNPLDWLVQFIKDFLINIAKKIISIRDP